MCRAAPAGPKRSRDYPWTPTQPVTNRPQKETAAWTEDTAHQKARAGSSKTARKRPWRSTSETRTGVESACDMACHHPLRAWRTRAGEVRLNREIPDAAPLALPCGGCLGCRTANAKAWALRCQLELNDHANALVATLTYDDEHVPPTLRIRDTQLYHKRLRQQLARKGRGSTTTEPIRLRHFTSGEYGEENGRPHYHTILYGPGERQRELVSECWREERGKGKGKPLGYVHIDTVTPAAIAYVAGYVAKKLNYKRDGPKYVEDVDPETGEVIETPWQHPFTIMSRNPGIGANAKQHTQSWRAYAIHHGRQIPVPKYLHEAWKQQATAEDIETLEYEKLQNRIRKTPITPALLAAAEAIAIKTQEIKAARRKQ